MPLITRRSVLSKAAVVEIFAARPSRSEDGVYLPSTLLSKELAKKFNIANKTVRDIWDRRCWSKVTRELWTEAEVKAEEAGECGSTDGEVVAKTRKPGRPKGAADTVSRKKIKPLTESTEQIVVDLKSQDKLPHHSSSQSEGDSVAKQCHTWSAENDEPVAFSPVPTTEEDYMELNDYVIRKGNPFVFDWERSFADIDLKTMVEAEHMAHNQTVVPDFAFDTTDECLQDIFQFRVVDY